ncbi:unnamed protein product [Tilletia laevis]|nr:unnamed protein product [Tilletia laevis]
MPGVHFRAGRCIVLSSPPPSSPSSRKSSMSSSPVSSPPRLEPFNAGFPADQAAEVEEDPEEDGPGDDEPVDADEVGDEVRSSDGEDNGADLIEFVVPPGGTSSAGEESAVFSQATQSSADDALALEENPDGDYLPPENDADNVEEDDGVTSDLGEDVAFLNFLDDDVLEVAAHVAEHEELHGFGVDTHIIVSSDEEDLDEEDLAAPELVTASGKRRSTFPLSDCSDFTITAVKRKVCYVKGTGGQSFPIFMKKSKNSL